MIQCGRPPYNNRPVHFVGTVAIMAVLHLACSLRFLCMTILLVVTGRALLVSGKRVWSAASDVQWSGSVHALDATSNAPSLTAVALDCEYLLQVKIVALDGTDVSVPFSVEGLRPQISPLSAVSDVVYGGNQTLAQALYTGNSIADSSLMVVSDAPVTSDALTSSDPIHNESCNCWVSRFRTPASSPVGILRFVISSSWSATSALTQAFAYPPSMQQAGADPFATSDVPVGFGSLHILASQLDLRITAMLPCVTGARAGNASTSAHALGAGISPETVAQGIKPASTADAAASTSVFGLEIMRANDLVTSATVVLHPNSSAVLVSEDEFRSHALVSIQMTPEVTAQLASQTAPPIMCPVRDTGARTVLIGTYRTVLTLGTALLQRLHSSHSTVTDQHWTIALARTLCVDRVFMPSQAPPYVLGLNAVVFASTLSPLNLYVSFGKMTGEPGSTDAFSQLTDSAGHTIGHVLQQKLSWDPAAASMLALDASALWPNRFLMLVDSVNTSDPWGRYAILEYSIANAAEDDTAALSLLDNAAATGQWHVQYRLPAVISASDLITTPKKGATVLVNTVDRPGLEAYFSSVGVFELKLTGMRFLSGVNSDLLVWGNVLLYSEDLGKTFVLLHRFVQPNHVAAVTSTSRGFFAITTYSGQIWAGYRSIVQLTPVQLPGRVPQPTVVPAANWWVRAYEWS